MIREAEISGETTPWGHWGVALFFDWVRGSAQASALHAGNRESVG